MAASLRYKKVVQQLLDLCGPEKAGLEGDAEDLFQISLALANPRYKSQVTCKTAQNLACTAHERIVIHDWEVQLPPNWVLQPQLVAVTLYTSTVLSDQGDRCWTCIHNFPGQKGQKAET